MKICQKIKHFALGMIITFVLSVMVIPAVAETVQKRISVITGVNIFLDDIKLNPKDVTGRPVEVFIYEGTTYLPVRAVAEAVGKAVSWDGETMSVYLGKHSSEEPVVMLHELDYFNKEGYAFNLIYNVEDNLKNTYVVGIETRNGENSQTYYINDKYRKLKGRYILDYDYRDTDVESELKIYGDGELIYTSPVLTGGVRPIDIEVDISGVKELKVESSNPTSAISYTRTYLVNTGLYQ